MDLSWTVEREREDDLLEPPRPLLSTWHYLRSSLRRRWRTIVGLCALGLLLGLGLVLVAPPATTATVTLLMAHPATEDAPAASATDVGLLNTRVVSDRTVSALGLQMTPEAFRSTVTVEQITSEIMALKISAPDPGSAVARGEELVSQYLSFRAQQMTATSSGLRSQYATRIADAQQQVAELTSQFDELSGQGAQGASQAFDVLARRTELNRKIAAWQEASDDATLRISAAIQSTHVIDPVHADPVSAKRAAVLAGASGLLVGGALGVGLVVFRALVTERLRRRRDIGLALGASVRFSVRSPRSSRRPAGLRRLLRGRAGWKGDDLATLALGLESALRDGLGSAEPETPLAPAGMNGRVRERMEVTASARPAVALNGSGAEPLEGPGRSHGVLTAEPRPAASREPVSTVALAAVGNEEAAADVLAATAERLREQGRQVFLVDLTQQGSLACRSEVRGLPVHRPDGIPQLARGPLDAVPGSPVDLPGDSWRADWESADVALALVEVDPGIEVQHLATWVEQVVPLVAAGAAGAEQLSTTGELVREAGLELPFAMMVGCDAGDRSLGVLEPRNDKAGPDEVRG
ncbi:hypothetical protein GCM10009740_06880 [Terrabacter terrae]|uniref:Polysaccharide chain length determinant N-terminal domain-containing protein n=1 Tax=Terrabacter terrae TaxID=318434 RepID=A0ABN2TVZ0_9MICO